ncbi:MAG TPA: nucleotide exchange factor GrpE [Candidatus Baltobacteraceae bacterium]|jgi:molecular chaperone GrpE|nr:nucleotide exchange factor GrpE [Candidatus Baltobacteraceae bacterium]
METETGQTASPVEGQSDQKEDAATVAPLDPREALTAANKRTDEAHERYLRALADLDNFKKRNELLMIQRLSAAKRTLLGRFLPVLDNLERALAFEMDSDSLREGLMATLRGFQSALQAEHVETFEVLGKPFDPQIAEAIAIRESNEHPDGTVLEEVQRGYRLGTELLRPALVIVTKPVDG